MMTLASVLLPDPLGPIRAWVSPCLTVKLTPRKISLPSMAACRSRITSSAGAVDSLGATGVVCVFSIAGAVSSSYLNALQAVRCDNVDLAVGRACDPLRAVLARRIAVDR